VSAPAQIDWSKYAEPVPPTGKQGAGTPPAIDFSKYESSGAPDLSKATGLSAPPPPAGFLDRIARWTNNVSDDIKNGTDVTGVGTILKKMGAHGVYSGNSEAVGDYMASLPLGLLRAVKGQAEVGQGKVGGGAWDIVAGGLQASTIPAGLAAGPVTEEAAAGTAGAVRTAMRVIPSAERAGQTLGKIKEVAGDVPIDVSKVGDTALNLYEQSQRGASLPKVVRDFITRVTKPGSDPLTYAEAKDFQSNVSRLSAAERMNLNPNTKRLIGQMNADLKDSLEGAADTVGKGQKFLDAMSEYHNAMTLRGWTDNMKANAWKAILTGAGLYGVKKFFGIGESP
jgi:hypothetical protein